MTDRSDRPLTVAQAASALGLSIHTVRAWICQRRLAYVRLGRAIRVLPAELDRLLKTSTVPAEDALLGSQHPTAKKMDNQDTEVD